MRFLKFWFPVIFYSVIIFGISAIPNLRTPLSGLVVESLPHVVEYVPLGFLFARALDLSAYRCPARVILFWVSSFVFLYGLSDEFHQLFVAGRTASGSDVLADVLGGFIGGASYLRYTKRRNLKG